MVLPDLNVARFRCAAAQVGDTLFAVGGRGEHMDCLRSIEALALEPAAADGAVDGAAAAADSWTVITHPYPPYRRSAPAAVAHDARLVVIGGNAGFGSHLQSTAEMEPGEVRRRRRLNNTSG